MRGQRAVAVVYDGGLRAGMHIGSPRRLGGDYFGVAVTSPPRPARARC